MPKSYIGKTICKICKKEFSRRLPTDQNKLKQYYCSVKCKCSDSELSKSSWSNKRREKYSEMMKGEKNPNFRNTWTEEQKQEASVLKKKQYENNSEYRYKVGCSNRGIKFTPDRIHAMHNGRDKSSYQHYPTDEQRMKISEKSKKKWTADYRKKHREKMEQLGYWVSLTDKDPYLVYYKEANWIDSMIEYFTDEEKLNLTLYGIFSKNNTKGYVRDHIVPRKIGYLYNLPPYILRHPANLKFISHGENIKKGFVDRRLTHEEISNNIEVLLTKIANFNKSWKEQEICINFIIERRPV